MLPAVVRQVAFIAALAAGTSVAESALAQSPPQQTPAQQVRLPDGRQMSLTCVGDGRVTVVLDAGLGLPMWSWAKVQDGLKRVTRVCAYDRAGYPGSDPGPTPRDAEHIVADLHALLQAARLPAPYVLVGESVGGYYVRLYADLFPREVMGLVLVDPAFQEEAKAFARASPATGAELARQGAAQQLCLGAIAKGRTWSETDPTYAACGPPPHGDAIDRAKATLSEEQNADNSAQQVGRAHTARSNLPVIVLTADRTTEDIPGITAGERAAILRVTSAAHQQIARGYGRGVQRTIRRTGQAIQVDQPKAVIDAVRQALSAAQ